MKKYLQNIKRIILKGGKVTLTWAELGNILLKGESRVSLVGEIDTP